MSNNALRSPQEAPKTHCKPLFFALENRLRFWTALGSILVPFCFPKWLPFGTLLAFNFDQKIKSGFHWWDLRPTFQTCTQIQKSTQEDFQGLALMRCKLIYKSFQNTLVALLADRARFQKPTSWLSSSVSSGSCCLNLFFTFLCISSHH